MAGIPNAVNQRIGKTRLDSAPLLPLQAKALCIIDEASTIDETSIAWELWPGEPYNKTRLMFVLAPLVARGLLRGKRRRRWSTTYDGRSVNTARAREEATTAAGIP